MLGDEEAMVIRDHQEKYFAHPFPTWSDYYERKLKKSWGVGRYVPLKAVFFLEQADRVEVAPIGQAQAAIRLCHLAVEKAVASWWCVDREESKPLRERLFNNTCDLVTTIPTFTLRTNITGKFWEAMEDIIVGIDEASPVIGVKGERGSCHVVAGNVK